MEAKSKSRQMRRLPDLPRLCRALTERAPLPMATLEGATRIVRYGNRAFCRLVGRERKHFVGRPIDELLPKKDVCLALIKRVYHTRKSESFTEQERVKPHPIFWSYTIWPVEATHGLVNLMIQVTETAAVHGNAVAMNEALILSSVRQHEMTEAAESLNFRLQAELLWRQRAETSLRESETRYRRLFEAAHDGVLLLDPGTRQITDANPFMTRLLGYPHAQLVGKELFEIGLLKDVAANREMFRKLKIKHKIRYEDLPLESQDGRHHEVEVVANLYPENNRPVIQCNIRDITARTQAAIAVNQLAAIVESSDDAIIGKDLNGRIFSWNRGAEKIFGYKAREMIAAPIMRLIPADRHAEEQRILAKIRRGQSVQHFETVRRTKDRRLINVSITTSPIKNAAGRIIGASKVARDITARKQTEDVLRRNEALFAALIDQAPVGVYVVDARMRLQRINPRARPMFKNIRPLIGRAFPEVVQLVWSRLAARRIVRRFRHTLQTGKLYQSAEFVQRRRDTGAEEIYEWQIQRVTLPDGEHGVVCFFNDITKRKRAELAQRRLAVLTAANAQANQEIARRRLVEAFLRESEQSQTRLLTESRELHGQLRHLTRQIITAQEEERKLISRELHDDVLQTLVGINVAMAALAEPGASVAPSVLRPKIARTQRMVRESLLAVRRFARNLRPTVLDDFGLIPALQDYTKRLMEQKKFRIDLTTSGEIDTLDSIRTTVLFWVAQEALTNVARHARATVVKLHVGRIPGAVRMEVQDNGKSFPVQATLAPGKNQRLGLLGMRERMDMIGGTLVIESTPGRGTLVRAEIPFIPAAPT